VQNISNGISKYQVLPKRGQNESSYKYGFLVKNWQFPNNANPPYVNEAISRIRIAEFTSGNRYNWIKEVVKDLPGIPGQGEVANPASMFPIHVVVRREKNKKLIGLYDPSYGVTYKDLDDVEKKIIEAYFEHEFVNKRAQSNYIINLPAIDELIGEKVRY
jgi:hypothetical protein